MPAPNDPVENQEKIDQQSVQAALHVASAKRLLHELQAKIGSHPEIGQAINKLQEALNILAVQTGGFL